MAHHHISHNHHAATADAVTAVNEDRSPHLPLFIDEPDLPSQPVEARGRLRVVDWLPALSRRMVWVFRLAQVQHRLGPRRRLGDVSTQVETVFNPRVVRRLSD